MKNKDYIIICVFVVLFLASAIIFKVYNVEILPSQFYGALIGVFITAIVTAFLLRGQTEGDEKREKTVKIFEEQLLIYKNFLTKLHEIVKEKKISPENFKELVFQISYVAMHTEAKGVNKILDYLKTTIEKIDDNENGYETFAKNILDIMLVLQESLYREKLDKTEVIDTGKFNKLVTNIETTATAQSLIDILSKSNFPNVKKYEENAKTLRFEIEGRETKFELVITSVQKGYVGIRNRYDYSDRNSTYSEILKNIGFYEWSAGLGMKHFKNYGTKNENELANKIKEDIETFIKNLK